INFLKKKYGATIQEMLAYYSEARAKLARLENAEQEIEDTKRALEEARQAANASACALTERRKESALRLQSELTEQVQSLNMPKALIQISLQQQNRTLQGDEKIEIFLKANQGEQATSVKEGSSGGEISRVQLALQTLLAGKENIPTIIFDEIDSNIGGETATVVGNKLKEIGERHQVICITHFPQVAESAHYHFQISKVEKEGRTLTEVVELNQRTKQRELNRMAGLQLAKV
ncbi:MAG: DNA repair protein RecN, partial [Parachlamydia sp.]|nr:DNA repair protein RecN [Parachlamydia sp.]